MPSVIVVTLTQVLIYLGVVGLISGLIGFTIGRVSERIFVRKELELLYVMAAEGTDKKDCGSCK